MGSYLEGAWIKPASIADSGKRQFRRRLVEVQAGSRRHAIGAGSQIDAVEVAREDLILAEPKSSHDGGEGFAHLAVKAALAADELHLDELLGDRAAALDDVPLSSWHGRPGQCPTDRRPNGDRSGGPR